MLHAFSFSSFALRIASLASSSSLSILASNSSAIRCCYSLFCLSASSAIACKCYFSDSIRRFYSRANFKASSFFRYVSRSVFFAASSSFCFLFIDWTYETLKIVLLSSFYSGSAALSFLIVFDAPIKGLERFGTKKFKCFLWL